MEIKDVLNFDITAISNGAPKDIHDSCTNLVCVIKILRLLW